ncbi:MAG: hypothetical protein ACRDK4_10155 [Solirubrobacteraceae bacterium]
MICKARSFRRVALLASLVSVAMLSAGAPAFGAFGVSKWEAGTCTAPECSISNESEFYRQAAGHPPDGITDFRFNTTGSAGSEEPEGNVKEVRVDIPPGLSVNPFATPFQCTLEQLEKTACPPESQVGEVKLTAHLNLVELLGHPVGATITPPNTPVYNMVPPFGHPLEAAFKVALFETVVHIVGGIETSGPHPDYHEFFTIENIPTTPELVESRLIFFGTKTDGSHLPFITMPSTCSGPQTTYLHVVSYGGQQETKAFTTPVGANGCDKIPFKPTVKVETATSQYDRPDGATVKVEVPQNADPASIDSSTLKDAYVSLPDGMTLNPAAASGLQACSDDQFGKVTNTADVCPEGSQIGTDTIETPDLPPGSLGGNVYVGQPLSNDPQSGQEYRIFIDAESPNYGVSLRLEGHVSADPTTGRLTTAVLENPQVPFSDFIVRFNSAHNPLANPLACGPATTNSTLVPYSGNAPAFPSEAFNVDFDGKGAACPSPLPFSLNQSAGATPTTAGANPTFAFKLERPEGQQYLSKLTTTLPPGLVGKIPAIEPLCGEPRAASGECPAGSEIGTAAVSVGSGPTPLGLTGHAYLTGPYGGQPYGLSVVVPAEKVGPYDYGKIVTRASVGVEPFSARIVVASQLPTVVGGAPIRLRSLSVNVTRPGFMLNPTNCGSLLLESTLTSTFGTSAGVSTPFQASGCSSLPFGPKLTASTKAKTNRTIGAALKTKIVFPKGMQSNIKSVFVQLPRQLPARLSTLNLACREATFNANPFSCPPGAYVGTVVVSTPVLPDRLIGSAVFVSHGGAAFPDLDLLLTGDGVHVILVGHTNIAKNITSSNFASLPDVPVSSVELKLPQGRKSALGAVGNLCKKPLWMPTTLTGQNGKVIRRKTRIAVAGCPHKRKHKHKRHHRGHRSRHRHAHHRRS